MAIVVPDGILGNDSLIYLREWILNKAKILAVVDLPIETFMPYTSTKTSILFLQKIGESDSLIENYSIFMATCETCGHNRRGQEIESDDIAGVSSLYKKWLKTHD